MLFHIQAFKSLSIKRPEYLYSLRVLNKLNQQELPLRDDLADQFVLMQRRRILTRAVTDVSDSLQNLMLQHTMSRSIDPCRPWKLPLEQSRSVPAKHPEDLSEKCRDSTASWLRGRMGQKYRRKGEKDERWEKNTGAGLRSMRGEMRGKWFATKQGKPPTWLSASPGCPLLVPKAKEALGRRTDGRGHITVYRAGLLFQPYEFAT
ncbi:hypothetical protein ACJ73_08726 [Blastomyces percursus]|uniref:Uncharacterized protein n=1 Tax=Blastomyces percursus TaxID=1658174 RepID=A0A1J9PPD9_9EURO|nr:hypothetical protein ACJ73_08726 [Blastomyces percursus]